MKFDLQDALLLLGVASIVGGVGQWSWPAAQIVLGVFCLAFVRAMGRKREGKG